MADELDAELLALAGGDDDALDTAVGADQPAQTPTPQPSPPTGLGDDLPKSSTGRRGLAQRKRKPTSSRRRRRDDSDGDVEGEDASDADSLGSGAMDESDSDAAGEVDEDEDEDDDDDDLPFPLEGKFHDEKDRREIMALPEVRREQILADREEEAMRRRQDAQLKQLLKRQELEAQRMEKRKRKAGATDLDDSPRKSSRPRTKQNEALEGFKRQREQALKDREKSAADRRTYRRGSPTDDRSDEDAEGESEVEWDDGVRNKSREEPPPELHDYERVRVGRSNFAEVCFYPGFEDAMIGCFTRVSVGMDKATGQNVYRMAQVKGFTEGKPYQLEGLHGKTFWVDQYAMVAHGKSEKEWPFVACSDGHFSEQEFNRWKIAVTNDSLRLPSKDQLRKSLDKIHTLLHPTWTESNIREKIARQNKLAHLSKPSNGANTPDFSSSLVNGTPKSKESMSQADRLYQLNQQNRRKNLEEIRKAQIAEKKRDAENRAKAAARRAEQERLDAEAAAAKAARDSLQVPGGDVDDLFGSDISRGGTPVPGNISGVTSGVNTPKRSGTPLQKGMFERKEREEKKGLPTFKKRNMDDDVIGSMDLGIDIDI